MFLSLNLKAQEVYNQIPTYEIKINPGGTYLFTNINPIDPDAPPDYASSPSYFNLSLMYNDPIYPLKTGDLIRFEVSGFFKAGDGFQDVNSALGAVFFGGSQFLFPGAQTVPPPQFVTMPTYFDSYRTDIPQDFAIPNGRAVYARVPPGATRIMFTVNDSFFSDNTDPNGDFKVTLKMQVVKYSIKKFVKIDDELQPENSEINIAPSKLNGCNSKEDPKLVKIKILCIKHLPNGQYEVVTGCKATNTISLMDSGPHNLETHTADTDHFGGIWTMVDGVRTRVTGETLDIPQAGLDFAYAVSEFAGKYSINIEAEGPDERQEIPLTQVIVKASIEQDLVSLKDILKFDIDSHPEEGFYGTPVLYSQLNDAVAQFRLQVEVFNFFVRLKRNPAGLPTVDPYLKDLNIPIVESEGSSLSWGGAFDIDKDWGKRHCLHRKGNHIDISMSTLGRDGDVVFDNKIYAAKYKKYLENAFIRAELQFPERGERPKDKNANHWHAQSE